jgi:anti-sigma regulatory factor (Ser/Thr protein kinase)
MPIDEAKRLAALRRYRILDTDPEQAFDDLTLLASHICGTPIALISLIDENRQWFKSRVGLSVTETARDVSFCNHAIQRPDELMIVPNALDDARFANNPLVTGDEHVRFYAGAPLLTTDGYALGALCVVDRVPRQLTDEQLRALDALRHQTEAQLELRRILRELIDAMAARDEAELHQQQLISELRESLDGLNKLAGLMEFCSTCQMNLTLPATPSSIHKVSEGLTQLLGKKGWRDDDIMKVDLAVQEALANGIRHGCKNDASKFIQCIVTTDASGELVVIVRDGGTGFEPEKVADPLKAENLLKTSGRGVFLINQLMDEVAFADGGREVQMRKRASPTADQDASVPVR